MDWTQFAIMFITFVGLFIWNRTESRADIRHMDAKLDANRELARTIHNESRNIIEAIREDMKDFHGRMCAIEERNRK
jgi:hypothetical protein